MSEATMAKSPALVSEFLDNIDNWTSEEFEEKARTYAERAELKHPINNAPSTVAAASVYLAGLTVNEKLTQETVSDASGVCIASIRSCYQQIAECEGIQMSNQRRTGKEPRNGLLLSRLREVFSRV